MSITSIFFNLIMSLLLCGSAVTWATIDTYQFNNEAQELRYQALIAELRCPKCQNQNLAGSDAPIAKDLKDRTYQLLQDGKTDSEIRDYMISRYGDFISYKPPVRGSTYALWFGPFALLLVVVAVLIWRRKKVTPPATHLNAEEAARLAQLLKRDSHD
ncbi:MAG: cytochrome c-type biogenesis protein CcmH [Moraxellaceae bacterium]|nr:cytochrome c-type biogenesis protein CcmH [Moraxellaceae bacterium]